MTPIDLYKRMTAIAGKIGNPGEVGKALARNSSARDGLIESAINLSKQGGEALEKGITKFGEEFNNEANRVAENVIDKSGNVVKKITDNSKFTKEGQEKLANIQKATKEMELANYAKNSSDVTQEELSKTMRSWEKAYDNTNYNDMKKVGFSLDQKARQLHHKMNEGGGLYNSMIGKHIDKYMTDPTKFNHRRAAYGTIGGAGAIGAGNLIFGDDY